MTRWFNWVRGRLNTGYDKLLIFQSTMLMCDLWLLRFKVGDVVPPHVDEVPGYRHYRVNLILKQASIGGIFYCFWPLYESDRIKVFRSDYFHSVSKILVGQRLVLSFGLCLRERLHAEQYT